MKQSKRRIFMLSMLWIYHEGYCAWLSVCKRLKTSAGEGHAMFDYESKDDLGCEKRNWVSISEGAMLPRTPSLLPQYRD